MKLQTRIINGEKILIDVENNNGWIERLFSRCEIETYAESLVNCKNCLNCKLCGVLRLC